MNVPLSLRWMVESYILLLGMLMLGLCLVTASMPRLRGVMRLCSSMLLISLAMGSLFYRKDGPNEYTFLVAGALLIGGFALMDETMTRFLNLPATGRWVDVVLLAGVLFYISYTIFKGFPMKGRVEVLVVGLAGQSIRSGYTLLRKAPSSLRLPARFLAGTFFVFSFFCVWRLVIPILRGALPDLPPGDEALMIDGISRLSKIVLLCASISFGYLWMAALQLSSELDALTVTDPLTSTMNRRGLEDRLRRELRRAEIAKTSTSLIALDVDHFKAINDRHGHHAGDVALVAFAKAINEMLRPTDFLGRFGGEEFVAVLPKTEEIEAVMVAERLRNSLIDLHLDFDPDARLTASFGVSVCRSEADLQYALRRCDQALYAAKQGGRNRVIAYSSLSAGTIAAISQNSPRDTLHIIKESNIVPITQKIAESSSLSVPDLKR